MPLFNRVATLNIGTPGDSKALYISGLRMTFSVEKTAETSPNTAKISVFNLANPLRRDIDAQGKVVILKAGYKQSTGAETLFIGKITKVEFDKGRPDSELKIEAEDGLEALLGKRFTKSYAEGASGKGVMADALSATGSPTEMPDFDAMEDSQFPSGFSSNGEASATLDKVAKKLKLKWTVVNGIIRVTSADKITATEQVSAPYIAERSGLLGSPVKLSGIEVGKVNGWQLETLLYPYINPSTIIFLENYGYFRVSKISHEGDTHGGDFKSAIEVWT